MAKLDTKRKVVLTVIIIGGVCLMLTGKPPQSVPTSEVKEQPQVNVKTEVQAQDEKQMQVNFVNDVQNQAIEASAVQEAEPVKEAVPAGTPKEHVKSTFEKFTVYQDNPSRNRYIMSGFMPSALCMTMDNAWRENCQEGRSCIKAIYDSECSAQESGWGGVYWLYPANNWGDQRAGHDLTGAIKLTLWARGEQGGEVISAFKMGGVGQNRPFTDSDSGEVGPVVLTKEWKQYTIYLFNKDLSNIIGGFAWVAKSKDNHGMVTFYLDDIHYE